MAPMFFFGVPDWLYFIYIIDIIILAKFVISNISNRKSWHLASLSLAW